MNRNFLVPLDGSQETGTILSEIQRIASLGDDVHLLHVVPSVNYPVGTQSKEILQLLDQALAYLRATRARWLPSQRGLDLVKTGDPAQEILGTALEKNINLIAMSTHGRKAIPRLLLGSVASEVVRKSQLPVLLARPDTLRCARPLRRILVGVDGVETPKDLLETVKTLAGGAQAEIILFHAVPAVQDPAPQWAFPSRLSVLSTPEHRLQELADSLEAEGLIARPLTSAGEPVEELLGQCMKLDVDLIALATHARTGLERVLEGSVAEGVMRRSPVAVLLQKPLVVKKPALKEDLHA